MSTTNNNVQSTGRRKKKKKQSLPVRILKKLLAVISTTLLSLFLVMVITGTIVATALTVYVLDFMDDSTNVTLQELESGSDTYFYGIQKNEKGKDEIVILNRVKTDVQRIPVSIDRIPQHVRDAFVYTEDERFYLHEGVDYKRTLSAFLNMFLHFYDTEQGGSTITQQLIKNLTGDKETSPQRKIREIFRAMQLERTYTKDEILEEYLNYIGFGGPINGVQLASIRYFGKNVDEITVPEAAVLAAIPKSPQYYGPFVETYNDNNRLIVDGKANNKERQRYVLYQMYKNGAITFDEYQKYLSTKLVYTDSEEYLRLHPEDRAEELEQEQTAYSWVVDAMYYEVADFLMKEYNIDQAEAIRRINKGGYKIYSTVDDTMQKYVEEKFLELGNLVNVDSVRRWADIDGDGQAEEYLPHVAFVAMNYDGSVKALAGDWGEKTTSLSTSYAVQEKRQVGSTMKPVASYGLALENDIIHWGSTFRDAPIMTDGNGDPWPTNYGKTLSYGTYSVYYFLQQSFNTVPAQLVESMTPEAVWDFCTKNLGMDLVEEDKEISPLALGALTYGITLEDLVNAYVPYGNQGVFNDAHIVTRIEDSTQEIIYQNDGNARYAVSDETAWVMNRLLKNVVDNGTGTAAKLSNKVVVGKTGTTDNWYDEAFVGLTRDFVSGITVGYKYNNNQLSLPQNFKSAQVWNNIIGEYANTMFLDTPADFDPVESVIEAPMCPSSGMIAGTYCGKGITGYWKSTNAPVCTGSHSGVVSNPAVSSSSSNNSYNNTSYSNSNSSNNYSNYITPSSNNYSSNNYSSNSYDNSYSSNSYDYSYNTSYDNSYTDSSSGSGTWGTGYDSTGSSTWDTGYDSTGGSTWDTGYDSTGGGTWDTGYDSTGGGTWDTGYDSTGGSTWDYGYDSTGGSTWDYGYDSTGGGTWDTGYDNTGAGTIW
ncbi:MAG: transglycosylase domain-containing protein [Ruminococcus sp.]|nr:transglycosylase domain-containing protein [Ruminococcus sp.]